MDGGRENRFLAGGAEISRRGGGHSAAPVHTKQKPRIVAKRALSWYSDIRRKQPSFQSLLNLLISHNRSKQRFFLNCHIPINSCSFSRDWSINWCKWCRSFFHRLRNIPYSSDTLLYSLLKYESRPSNSDCLSSFVTSV